MKQMYSVATLKFVSVERGCNSVGTFSKNKSAVVVVVVVVAAAAAAENLHLITIYGDLFRYKGNCYIIIIIIVMA
jgi:hypothetical protein